jgi:serine/threonine protein kinase/Tfp pilus assembly protein PilF
VKGVAARSPLQTGAPSLILALMSIVPGCDEDLVRRLPLPLAQLYRRAHNAKTPLERHLTAYYLWEAALKLLASAAVVTYADLSTHDPKVAERLQNLARPALGHWWEFVRLLVPALAESDDGFRQARDLLLGRTRDDLPRAAGLDACLREALEGQAGARSTVRLAELFDRLVRYRNRELGHGAAGQAAAGVYERVGSNLLLGVAELLGRFDVLAGRRLVYVAEVRRHASGHWLVEPYELTGESARRLPSLSVGDAAALPHPQRVYLAQPGADGPPAAPLVSLHPLVSYDADTAEAFFLNARRGARRGEYLCYATGRVAERPDAGGEQRDLLARVLGLAVDEAAVGAWAARSQAEEPPAEAAPESGAAPRRVGEFEVLSELGRGGMGVVYRAWQPSLGRQVALKCLLRLGDPKAEARFAREIRALGKVDHLHLVKIFTSGSDGDRWFYAMELIDGVSLGALCDRLAGSAASTVGEAEWHKALTTAYDEERKKEKSAGDATPTPPAAAPPRPATRAGRGYVARAVEVVRQVAGAAHALHEAGVVHRDIKPGNVVLTPDGQHAVLMDLGLAQLADEAEGRLTRTRQFVGTLRYASPEQVLAVGGLDRRADVYGLGATLWELLTLRPIYAATDDTPTPELMRRIQYEEPARVRKVNPNVPADLEAIVLKCLEKDAAKRYATAAELADDLRRFQDGEPVRARPIGEAQRLWRWCRRRPLVPGIAASLLLLLLVGFALVFWQWRRAENNAALARENAERAERHFQATLSAADTLVDKLVGDLKPIAGARRETVARVLRTAQGIYDDLPDDARQRPEVRRGKARMLTAFSEVYRDLGDSDRALASADQARDICRELLRRDPADPDLRRDLARSLVQAGIALRVRGDSNGALAAFRESLALREALAGEDPIDPERQREVAESQSRVGGVLLLQRETAQAKVFFEKALEARRRLAEAHPDDARLQQDLTNAHLNAGDYYADFFSAARDRAKAIAAYREAVTLADQFAGREPDNLEWQDLLCRARTVLGETCLYDGQLEVALGTLEPALEIARRNVARDPANATWRGHWLYAREMIADVRADPKNPVEDLARKLANWQEDLALCERRLREDPEDVAWLRRRANCHVQSAMCRVGLAQAGQSPEENYSRAAVELETAVGQWQRLADLDPDNGYWATGLALAVFNLSGVHHERKEAKKEGATYVQSMRINLAFSERLLRRSPEDPSRRRGVASDLVMFGSASFTAEDAAAARDAELKALEIQEALAAADPDNLAYQRDLADTHWYLAAPLMTLGRVDESLRHRRESVAAYERIVGRDPDNRESQGDLLQAYDQLIRALHDLAALENFAEALGVPLRGPRPKVLIEAWDVWARARPLRLRVLGWQTAGLFVPAARPDRTDVTVSGAAFRPLARGRVTDTGRVSANEAGRLYRRYGGRIDYTLDLLGAWIDLAGKLDAKDGRGAAEARTLLRRASLVLLRAAAEGKLTPDEQQLFGALGAASRRLPPGAPPTQAEGRIRKALGAGDYRAAAREAVLELLDGTAGDRKTDITLLRGLLVLSPADTAVRKRLVRELHAAWRFTDAAREQERLIRDLGPAAAASDYELLAEFQLGLGDADRAAETFAAAKHDPADPAARAFALRVALSQRRFGVVRELALALAADPGATAEQKQLAGPELALVEVETGALADAEARVKRALAATPRDGYWRFARGYLHAVQGKADDEDETAVWAALGGKDPRYLWVWGWFLAVRDKRYPEGLQIMEQAASHELVAHDPVFFDHLGDVYRLAGRPDRAREAWRKALALFPKTAAPDDHRRLGVERKLKNLSGG